METRKHNRLIAQDDAFAALKGEETRVGRITDISAGGLSISYPFKKNEKDGFKRVDIYLTQNGFRLSDIPCRIVYEEKDVSNGASNGDTINRCGLRFTDLADDHKTQLNYFLSHFTAGVKKGRKLGTRIQTAFSSSRLYALPLFIDFLLLTVALLGMQLAKRQTVELSMLYLNLYGIFFLFWLVVSVGMEKYRKIFTKSFSEAVVVILKSNVVIVYLISFAVVLWSPLARVSRMQTFGVCGAFLLLELGAFCLYHLISHSGINGHKSMEKKEQRESNSLSYPLMILDGMLLFVAFMAMNFLKRGGLSLPAKYDQAVLLLFAIWMASSLIAKKFNPSGFRTSYTAAISHCFKAAVFMSAGLGLVIFALRLFYYSRIQLFGTPAILLGLELALFYLYYLYSTRGRLASDIETADGIREIIDLNGTNRDLPEIETDCQISEPVTIKLAHALEFFNPSLFSFIKKTIDLTRIDRCDTALVSTDDIEEVEAIEADGHRLLINLHKTNDVRWFNRYFLQVFRKLDTGGYFVGKIHTFDTHKKLYREKYPRYLAGLFYGLNFIWCRVFPKLPVIQKLYFALTKGRNRIVSKAEVFGRLYFSGFKVVAEMEIENRLYFIAQKVNMPSLNTNPTFGPIVRLKRFGFEGQMMTVYKFRTMYPYSEFLQEYVFENNDLQTGGKFKDDFRVTDWGKFMRATWLDELPMIVNWLKGELKLFGVRPLSRQYLSLYTDELKQLRTKVVPGLIPPFYADLPNTLSEIIDSELQYIKAYLRAPIKTQLSYLWRSGVNIVFKGARSK